MKTFIQEAVESMSEDLNRKKELVIKSALFQKGVSMSLDSMLQNPPRFTRLQAEHHNGTELYYYDDGSFNGLFIVGFKMKPYESQDFSKDGARISVGYDVITEEPEWNKKRKQ